VDESLFYGRSQHRKSGRESGLWHLRGISDDMVRKNGAGLGKPSPASLPTDQVGGVREDSPIRKRKGEAAGRVADEAVVPVKLWKHNRGKGLYFSQGFQRNKGACIARATKHRMASGVSAETA
jgi:hypothetical protein